MINEKLLREAFLAGYEAGRKINEDTNDISEGISRNDINPHHLLKQQFASQYAQYEADVNNFPYWVIKSSKWYDPEGLDINENRKLVKDVIFAGTQAECFTEFRKYVADVYAQISKNKIRGPKIEDEGSDFILVYYPNAIAKETVRVIKNPNYSDTPLNESTSNNDAAVKAWIGNLGKYNDGELVGEWVDFPCSNEELEAVMQRIGISEEPDAEGFIYDEVFVADYDGDFGQEAYKEFGEYPNFDELNEFAENCEKLKELDDEYGEGFASNLMDQAGYTSEELIDKINNIIVISADTEEDLGYYVIGEQYGGIERVPSGELEQYFDFEALGRDLGFDEYENDQTAGEYWCGDENATDYEIGEAYVEDADGIANISNADNYFDYEAFGRDCAYDYTKVDTDDYKGYYVYIG